MLKQRADGSFVTYNEGGDSDIDNWAEQGNVFVGVLTPQEVARNKTIAAQKAKQEALAKQQALLAAKKAQAEANARAQSSWFRQLQADARKVALENHMFGSLINQNGFDQNNVTVENRNPTLRSNLKSGFTCCNGMGDDDYSFQNTADRTQPDFGEKVVVATSALIPVIPVQEDYGYQNIKAIDLTVRRAVIRSRQARGAR